MENYSVPDLPAAARHLENAKTALAETVHALRNHEKARDLTQLGARFGEMAELFRAGMLNGGLKVPLVDAKMGARAMGPPRQITLRADDNCTSLFLTGDL